MDDVALWRVHVELEDRPGRLGELATAVGAAGLQHHLPARRRRTGRRRLGHRRAAGQGARRGRPGRPRRGREAAGHPVHAAGARRRHRALRPRHHRARAGPHGGRRSRAARRAPSPRCCAPARRPRTQPTSRRGRTSTPCASGRSSCGSARAWPFTATELSRAAALLELAAQLVAARAPPQPRRRARSSAAAATARRSGCASAGPADAPLVAALHARCSPAARRARFLSPTPRLGAGRARRACSAVDGGAVVLAVTVDGGSAVGLATLGRARRRAASRFAVLVEDAWQGRGLGTALLRRAADVAARGGSRSS